MFVEILSKLTSGPSAIIGRTFPKAQAHHDYDPYIAQPSLSPLSARRYQQAERSTFTKHEQCERETMTTLRGILQS